MYWKPNWKTEKQTKLNLQKISKGIQNLQEIEKNYCPNEYMHWNSQN